MAVTHISWESKAYIEGYQSGRADRFLGIRSDYAYFGYVLDYPSSYSYHYSHGYRRGLLNLSF